MLRKTTAFLAAFLMIASFSNAQSTSFIVDGLRYVIVDEVNKAANLDSVITLSGEDITIPDSVTNPNDNQNYGVKGIGFAAFQEQEDLRTIVFPTILDSIGDKAFMGCYNLETPQLPATLTKIGWLAFERCSSISSFTIPAATIHIGSNAFMYCSSVRNYTVEAANPNYKSEAGVLFNKSGSILIKYPSAKSTTSYTIPDGVSIIEMLAFEGNYNLTSITFPTSVDSIAEAAFLNCLRLQSISLPEGLTGIGRQAFASCLTLETVNIPASLKRFHGGPSTTFVLTPKLTNINVHSDNTEFSSINGVLFDKEQTTIMVYPSGKTDNAYTIPASVTDIEIRAFSAAIFLRTVTLPANLDTVARYAFLNCKNLETINSNSETAPKAHLDAFAGELKPLNTITLNVPVGSADSYRNHSVWSQFNIIENSTSSNEEIIISELRAYPNPTTGLIVVTCASSGNAVLYNPSGQIVKIFALNEGENYIDIADQPNGVYVLKMNDSLTRVVKK